MSVMTSSLIVMAILIGCLLIGMPVFASMGISGMVGLLMLRGVNGLLLLPMNIYGHLNNFTLLAVPLFLAMAELIIAMGLAKDLYNAAEHWLGGVPGGLSVATIAACAIFAAMSGSMSASAAGIGSLAVPEMRSRGYSQRVAGASVACGGGLAFIIPPSLGMIIYGWLSGQSVGDMFISGVLPGIMLALAMIITVLIWAKVRPQDVAEPKSSTWSARWKSLAVIWPGAVLIFAVLGVIYAGIATPTEAAGVGSVIALLLGVFYYKRLHWAELKKVFKRVTATTVKLGIIITSAMVFGNFLALIGMPQAIARYITGLGLSSIGLVIIICLFFFVVGAFFDEMSIMMIVLPLLLPTLQAMNVDLIWFGILMCINMQLGVITPPFGVNLFLMKGVIPELEIQELYKGVIPFILAQLVVVALIIAFPAIATCMI